MSRVLGTKFNNYGGGPFVRYNVTEKFFGYTEYEYLNYGFLTVKKLNDLNFYSWFVGIGYSEPISNKVSFNITPCIMCFMVMALKVHIQVHLCLEQGITIGL